MPCITTVLNGRAIASSQKKLKCVAPPLPPDIQAAQAGLKPETESTM